MDVNLFDGYLIEFLIIVCLNDLEEFWEWGSISLQQRRIYLKAKDSVDGGAKNSGKMEHMEGKSQ